MERRDLPQARRALSRASLSWRKAGLKTALGAALAFSVLLPLNAQAAAPAGCAALKEKYPDWKGKTLVNAINPHTPGYESIDPKDPSKYVGFDIDRKSTRLNSSHMSISYAVFCLKKKNTTQVIIIS